MSYCPACMSCNAAMVMRRTSMLFACAECLLVAEVFPTYPDYHEAFEYETPLV